MKLKKLPRWTSVSFLVYKWVVGTGNIIGTLRCKDGDSGESNAWKLNLCFFFNLDHDYSYYYFVKCNCRQTLLELNSQEPDPSSEGEHYLFMSSIKCEIRHFYLVGVQWCQKKYRKCYPHTKFKVVVLLVIPIPFWSFWLLSLPSDLRVPF